MSYIIPLLGYSAPPLSLNDRQGWQQSRRVSQQLQGAVIQSAQVMRLPKGLARVELALHWCPAVERQRDDDNPYPAIKAAADALVRYGLCASDDHRTMTRRMVIERVDKMAPLHFFGTGRRVPARLWLSVTDLTPALPDEAP